jgi:hypothetical protein
LTFSFTSRGARPSRGEEEEDLSLGDESLATPGAVAVGDDELLAVLRGTPLTLANIMLPSPFRPDLPELGSQGTGRVLTGFGIVDPTIDGPCIDDVVVITGFWEMHLFQMMSLFQSPTSVAHQAAPPRTADPSCLPPTAPEVPDLSSVTLSVLGREEWVYPEVRMG